MTSVMARRDNILPVRTADEDWWKSSVVKQLEAVPLCTTAVDEPRSKLGA